MEWRELAFSSDELPAAGGCGALLKDAVVLDTFQVSGAPQNNVVFGWDFIEGVNKQG